MGNWRKVGGSHHQVGQWNRSFSRRPPLGTWQSNVPSWEKRFCASVGAVPWGKLLEAKRYMYLFDNVVKWDDSAGREAFDNAKQRFWAEINGFPCNISLPDPNIYIDDVDWNSSIDPELIQDLEREKDFPSEETKEEKLVVLGSSVLLNQKIIPTGWGEAEEAVPTDTNQLMPQGWGPDFPTNVAVDPWQQYYSYNEPAEYGWQSYWDHSWGWNQRDQYGNDLQKTGKGRADGNWGSSGGYYRRRENISWQKNSAYQPDDRQVGRGRKYNRGKKRGNFGGDRQYVEKIQTN
ncbi:hypothetical protein L6164_009349 [Bauhinia variegata]|uniref:Uncharacterized protein n=1 Tax=Bauhinia variegata TaxID=167791 RepID=A0ACB9PQ04_BAUVA|nr:hypothetical protein L6164_009349 [Bauhinia variegata]